MHTVPRLQQRSVALAAALTAFACWVLWPGTAPPEQQPAPKAQPHQTARARDARAGVTASLRVMPTPRPTVTTAERAQKAGGAAMVEGSADIWSTVQQLLQHRDQTALLQARHGIALCQAVQSSTNRLGILIGGGHSDLTGPLTPQRQEAALALVRRCNGFMHHGTVATANLLDQVQQRLDAAGWAADGATEPALQAALQSGWAPAVEEALHALSPASALGAATQAEAAGAGSPGAAQTYAQAVRLVACELGRDCSAQGLPALLACAFDSQCDAASNVQATVPEQVQAYRTQILATLRTASTASQGAATQPPVSSGSTMR